MKNYRHPAKNNCFALFKCHVDIVARTFFRANAATLAIIKVKSILACSRNNIYGVIGTIHEAVVALKTKSATETPL